jgi:hypothetical protein
VSQKNYPRKKIFGQKKVKKFHKSTRCASSATNCIFYFCYIILKNAVVAQAQIPNRRWMALTNVAESMMIVLESMIL